MYLTFDVFFNCFNYLISYKNMYLRNFMQLMTLSYLIYFVNEKRNIFFFFLLNK